MHGGHPGGHIIYGQGHGLEGITDWTAKPCPPTLPPIIGLFITLSQFTKCLIHQAPIHQAPDSPMVVHKCPIHQVNRMQGALS